MTLYDGNQLSENPTSTFQVVVSILYTFMMAFYMSLGAFGALGAQKQLTRPASDKGTSNCACLPIGQTQHPTQYISDLVRKRNAICRGLLAFIPAVYSLAHLYTSSLHTSSLYTASNVIFAALMGYSAYFMGKTLQQLVIDSDHMDTTKAVYETLYMLSSTCDRLRRHKPSPRTTREGTPVNDQVSGIFDKVDAHPQPMDPRESAKPAWLQPWVLFNVFLAIGAQDDSRIWPMFTAWLRRWPESLTVWVQGSDNLWCEVWDRLPPTCYKEWRFKLWKAHPGCQWLRPSSLTHVAYGYWLYSQDNSIRTITGSMVHQGISDEMVLAGCRSGPLYYTALGYIDTLSQRVANSMVKISDKLLLLGRHLTFTTEVGQLIEFEVLAKYFERIFHANQTQALSMACERYVCRLTPAAASLCLPTGTLVPTMLKCWKKMTGQSPRDDLLKGDAGYWCHLWLAYMHVVLLGVDLLRMHNNQPYFKDTKSEAGTFRILASEREKPPPPTQSQPPSGSYSISDVHCWHEALHHLSITASAVDDLAEADASPEHPDIEFRQLHILSDGDLYALAALVATLLLKDRMEEEGIETSSQAATTSVQGDEATAAVQGGVVPVPKLADNLNELARLEAKEGEDLAPKNQDIVDLFSSGVSNQMRCPSTYGDYLQPRNELVSSHSSLPAIVEGVECTSAADWVQEVMSPLTRYISAAAIAAVIVSTIACNNGVFLVSIAGTVQALGEWALLLVMERLPKKQLDYGPKWYRAIMAMIANVFFAFYARILEWVVLFLLWLLELFLRPLWLLHTAFVLLFVEAPARLLYKLYRLCKTVLLWVCHKDSVESASQRQETPARDVEQGQQDSHATVQGQLPNQVDSEEPIANGHHAPLADGDESNPPTGTMQHLVPEADSNLPAKKGKQSQSPCADLAEALAAIVAIASSNERAVGAAREMHFTVDPEQKNDLDTAIATSSTEALKAAVDFENEAIKYDADRRGRPNMEQEDLQIGDKAQQHLCKVLQSLSDVRVTSIQRLQELGDKGIGLYNCFESSRRHLYRGRITPWDVAIKVIAPCCFYTFLVCVFLAVQQEPWYTGKGMCLGRCYNHIDCQSEQTIELDPVDNALRRWISSNEREALKTIRNNPPACPGLGSVNASRQCGWMAHVLDVKVLQPVAFGASDNSTLCRVEVLVVDHVTGEPPAINTTVPAVWYSMTDGRNDNASEQLRERAIGGTNSSGYANMSSLVGKPFISSSGHGCNVTVLASEITTYTVSSDSVLHNSTSWGCVDCQG